MTLEEMTKILERMTSTWLLKEDWSQKKFGWKKNSFSPSLLLFVNKIMFTKCFFLLQKCFLFVKWVLFMLKMCFISLEGCFF